jgi:hypothetical protein
MNIQLSLNDRKMLENALNIKGIHGKIDIALAKAEHQTMVYAMNLLKKAVGAETKAVAGYVARRVRQLRYGAREGFKKGVWLGTTQMYADKRKPNASALRSGKVNQSQYPNAFVGKDKTGASRIFARTGRARLTIMRVKDEVDAAMAAALKANENQITSYFSMACGTAVKQIMLEHFTQHKAKKR